MPRRTGCAGPNATSGRPSGATRGLATTGARLPVTDLTAQTARLALLPLFVHYGAPLVLKADNGSAFGAADFLDFLAEFGVTALFSPQQVWQARATLTAAEFADFQVTVERCRREARRERGLEPQQPLTRIVQAAVDRVALSRALVAHDLLLFRRRRLLPRIPRPKAVTNG